jgi:hypothetical protein
VVVGALVWGGKAYLEHTATREVEVATEMYEDGQANKALAKLRSLDKWLAWTQAVKDSEDLRQKVRAHLVQMKEQKDWEREARRWDAQVRAQDNIEAQRKLERDQIDRRMELERERIRTMRGE